MPVKQAKAMVAIVQELQEARLAEVATKEEIGTFRLDVKAEFAVVRSELKELESFTKTEFAAVRSELKEMESFTKAEFAAVRSEMREMESRTKAEFATVRTEINRIKFDLLKWIIPFMMGQLALIITILFKMLK